MKGINKIGKIITKILEVFHWVGTALMAAATVCALAAPEYIGWFVSFEAKECCGAELNIYGFEVNAPVTNGNVDMTTFFLFGISSVVILALMSLVFHNLHRIFKNAETGTPFHEENIRLLKRIGMFSIDVPAVGLIMKGVIQLVVGLDTVEISISQSGVFMGIIVFCLTQFFAHGAKLEQDVDGLL